MFLEYFSEITDTYLTIGADLADRNDIALLAMLGGILPSLIWLWFWLKEDKKRPEPRLRLALTFVTGMVTGFLVLPFQYFSDWLISPVEQLITNPLVVSFLFFGLWAFSEEFAKYLAAYFSALRTKVAEERVDSIIYLITAALGFSAFENSLYLLAPLLEGSWLASVVLVNFRFIGASLLHIASSAIIGFFLAFSFYKGKFYRKISLILGLILATGLHTIFNLLIIEGKVIATLAMLGLVWIVVVIVLLLLEKVKKLPYPSIRLN
ncbi:MAG: hypothetical protein G01um1014107_203 [Parcubacteria group bacterium Gr01-1014_107]|nr:MAG: hypothetical protein G01um1014107_203 [Parcubacteria group bacterium Gr01-1014_107]